MTLSLVSLVKDIESLQATPASRTHPRQIVFRAKRIADFVGHARPETSQFFRRWNPYPKPFEHVRFDATDGVSIAGWLGPRNPSKEPCPFGIVIVPGMFSTKDDTVHKRRAIRMWRAWKVPVLVIDQRAFGESKGIATAGWKEAYDVLGAAKYLKARTGVERVGVLAESLGGAATLNALALDHEERTDHLQGGALLYSAFVDAKDAVTHISNAPAAGHPFASGWAGFRRLLRIKSRGAYERFDEYLDDAARVNGLSGLEELLDVANPKWRVGLIHQPTLLVHATNDPVVPVRHARRMERYAADMDHIQALTTDWGGHTAFESLDPWWFWEVTRRFFGFVNGCSLPNPEGPQA